MKTSLCFGFLAVRDERVISHAGYRNAYTWAEQKEGEKCKHVTEPGGDQCPQTQLADKQPWTHKLNAAKHRGCYVIYLFFNTVSSVLFILFHPSPHSPICLLTIHHLNHFIRQPTSCIFFSAMTATELKRFISILISTLWL